MCHNTPADNLASNKYTFVCKRHWDITSESTYNLRDFSALEVLDNEKSALTSFGLETHNDKAELPYILDSKDAQNIL